MLVCNACRRHYRFEDGRCPFCSTPHRSVSAGLGAAALAGGLMLFGCEKDDEEGDTSDSDAETTGDTDETGDSSGTDTGDTTTTDSDSGGTEYGAAPLPDKDWAPE